MNILLNKSANTSLWLIIAFERKHAGQKDEMYLKVEIPSYVSQDFELHRSLGRKVRFLFFLGIPFVWRDEGFFVNI